MFKMLILLVEFRVNFKQIAEVPVIYVFIYSLQIWKYMNVVLVILLLSILTTVVLINFLSVRAHLAYALNAVFNEIIFLLLDMSLLRCL